MQIYSMKKVRHKYNNLVTVTAQKMGKSLGNFITLDDLFKKYNHINIIQSIRNKYREEKKYAESDKIRDELKGIGITLNDRR